VERLVRIAAADEVAAYHRVGGAMLVVVSAGRGLGGGR
jgi:hypothetical protein